ncbi:hypothetical protein ACGFNU_09220 [Spirillospora sp. NPDC048911]|uniref:hypothetical protein n=1 Tax=Spirillospora sp. NPDC048911 TaxID=3364527 RepID=UPI0037134555
MTTLIHTAGRRSWTVRRALCFATVAACLPYIALKLVWLAGGDLGVSGDAATEMHGTAFEVANAITMGAELVAVLIVFAFTYPWGRRIPAWLVLVPMWVGTGLLAPIALGLPLGMVVQAIAGGSPVPDNEDSGDMANWVFAVVYSGFTIQAITLVGAFVLYARSRWPHLFRMAAKELRPGATRSIQVLFVNGSALVAAAVGVTQLGWAFGGGDLGGDPRFVTAAQRTFVGIGGPLAFAGALGALALVHRRGRLPGALAAAWVGAGYLFAWGLFSGGTGESSAMIHIFGAIAGLLLAIASILTLAENEAERPQHAQGGRR